MVSETTIVESRRRDVLSMSQDEFQRLSILAKMYAASSFNYKNKNKEGDYFLIMLKGYEVGFSPTVAVDYINIISGKPCISAAGMLALIQASSEVEEVTIVGDDKACSVTIKRKNRAPHTEKFTMEMAKAMKTTEYEGDNKKTISLAEKSNWRAMPALMLKWRAVSFAARACCPDIIGGMYTTEEMREAVVDDVANDGATNAAEGKHAISAPAAPALPAGQPAPSPDDEPAPPPKPWHQTPALQTLVERARSAGYIEPQQGASDLLALLGTGAAWANYATLGDAASAIKAAVEALKGGAANPTAPANAPAAPKPAGKAKKDLTDISTAIVESAEYTGERIIFKAQAGNNVHIISCWSRDEFAGMVGEAFATEWSVREWSGSKEAPGKFEFSALKLTYGKNDKGYWTLIKAEPVRLEDEAIIEDDPFADLKPANSALDDYFPRSGKQ